MRFVNASLAAVAEILDSDSYVRFRLHHGKGGSIGREAALTFGREGALVVGCDLQVEAAQSTVAAVRAAADLNALSALLDRAEAYAEAKRIKPVVLLNE